MYLAAKGRRQADCCMNENIVKFQPLKTAPSEPLIWTCQCGSRSYHLYNNGRARCIMCDEYSTEIRVFDSTKEPPAK